MLIGVAAVVLGGFIIICAAPFASHRLYKAGGGLFLASGEVLKWLNQFSLFIQLHFRGKYCTFHSTTFDSSGYSSD